MASAGNGTGAGTDRQWLTRLSVEEWMRAGVHELEHAYRALAARDLRGGLAHARRAAGMGLNARLCLVFDAGWGRSYMEHLAACAADARVPEAVRDAARRLVEAPARSELVTLGPGPVDLADAAKTVLAWVADQV
jgi:HEPN domain-containing protein